MAEQPLMPSDVGPVATGAGAGPDPGLALVIGLAVGLGYYWFAGIQGGEPEDEGDEEYDDEEDEEVEVERPRRVSRMSKYADATTDSLIDRPAILASSGKPGDCYKAVKLLPASQGLATTQKEKSIFRRVLKAVSDDCQGAPDAIERAMVELEDQREEIEDVMDIAPRSSTYTVQEGLRRTKKKKTPRDLEVEELDRVSHSRGATSRGGRPRGASVHVKRASGASYRLRKEKAPTKRGYKWRKEES